MIFIKISKKIVIYLILVIIHQMDKEVKTIQIRKWFINSKMKQQEFQLLNFVD
jgi:hypothetical protein